MPACALRCACVSLARGARAWMCADGEVVKVLNQYWITPDMIQAKPADPPMTVIRSSSVLTEVPADKK